MSFFKKLGKSKTAEFSGTTERKPQKGSRLSASLKLPEQRKVGEDKELDFETNNANFRAANEKEKERKKYKDMSGILLGGAPDRAYPTFNVHYLGRIPTSAEYGREAVEEPVNQLCKLREKQKLKRVFLTFNIEGLYCHEVSGPFLRTKKDGYNIHIPLHHLTYGVGCAAHPTVFACIAKMYNDLQPANQVLVLHAFVCDKPETTQAVTYWQLQAYIEAYENLKRKKILQMRRKQAMDGTLYYNQKLKVREMEALPEEVHINSSQDELTRQPMLTARVPDHQTEYKPAVLNTAIPSGIVTEQHSDARARTNRLNQSPNSSQHVRMVHVNPALPLEYTNQKHGDLPQTGKTPLVRVNSMASSSSSTESASGDSNSAGNSPLASLSRKPSKSFENRIDELQCLVTMDAEKLKKLMINEHPTLARRIYYRATVDESGVFQQGKGELVEDEVSEA